MKNKNIAPENIAPFCMEVTRTKDHPGVGGLFFAWC